MDFFERLLVGGVRGVTFLPKKLARPKKHPRAHLPAHHVGPLVDEHRQIAVALNPPAEVMPDDGLAGGPNDVRLFERVLQLDAGLAVLGRHGP